MFMSRRGITFCEPSHEIGWQFTDATQFVTTFPWLLISFCLLVHATGSFLLAIGLIDLALALTAAVGIGMQAQYLPGTRGGCSDSKARAWQVNGDHKSFFVVASELGHRKTPSASCKAFVEVWQLAAACL